MINLYSDEKRMEHEEKERKQIANKAWMYPKKKHNRNVKTKINLPLLKSLIFKKHSRRMFDS